jgi:transketolase
MSLAFGRARAQVAPAAVRRIVLTQSKRANVGHIGSCLSVVEILAALYDHVLRVPRPDDPERDRFVLSKGHAALALYAVLSLKGWIDERELDSFYGEDTLFGVHPDAAVPGIDFASGSLGQGPSIAAGAALAARMHGSARRVFCLISDAELNEGAVWEAAMFAAHHRLSNLTLILDLNGQQAFGRTREVVDCSRLRQRWTSFGWRTSIVDGHSVAALVQALNSESAGRGKPHIVLARTRFGRGVSFMEKGLAISQSHLSVQPINWHYLPMSDVEYRIAMSELERSY